jgi:hypothetical protein
MHGIASAATRGAGPLKQVNDAVIWVDFPPALVLIAAHLQRLK